MGTPASLVLLTCGLKLKMITQQITLLLAILSFANSLPSSSSSIASSKGSSSNSAWSGNKSSKSSSSSSSTCCSSTSPVTFETTGMGSFYQGERLGTYEPVGQSSDGRSCPEELTSPWEYYVD